MPPREIEPLNVLPAVGGVHGAVFKAVNQLLGFFVAYQPRLFLAAIIAGCWVGWTCHRRLLYLETRGSEAEDSVSEPEVALRRAA